MAKNNENGIKIVEEEFRRLNEEYTEKRRVKCDLFLNINEIKTWINSTEEEKRENFNFMQHRAYDELTKERGEKLIIERQAKYDKLESELYDGHESIFWRRKQAGERLMQLYSENNK